MTQSRREFIRSLAALLAAGVWSPALATNECKIEGWFGDDFTIGHRFREAANFPKFSATPEKTVDFVIVGGGISGLASAFYLRDHNVLVLEQYEQAGGHARGGSFKGVDYSYGAAFVDTTEGIYGKLFGDLGIAPQKIDAGDNSFFWEKKFEHGVTGDSANSLYKHFKQLTADAAGSIKILPTEDTPASMSTAELAKLDSTSFASTLTGYPPEFVALIDSICRSAVCGSTQRVSALTGLYLIEDLASSNYVFKGGNAAISKALVRAIDKTGNGRLQRGCFVWQTTVDEKGGIVQYTDKAGAPHTVACKHLIVATQPMVAWRQVKGIEDKTRAQLMQFKYGSYLVANLLLNKRVFEGAYDNFFSSPFTVTDMTIADTPYLLAKDYKADAMGSVLTAYQPWEPGTEGRPLLLVGDKSKFAKEVRDQMNQIIPELDKHLEGIALSRWGHAIAVPSPGYYARLAKFANSYSGPISFAHSSLHGMPSTEAAIRGARFSADRALGVSKR